MNTWKRVLAAAAAGYILMFFSEFLFINGQEMLDLGLVDLVARLGETYLAYFAEAYLLLALLDRFKVGSPAAFFLAGAAYGWLLEGVVNPTMYDWFPFQIPFTGLSWHALIDVMIGLYLMRLVLRQNRPGRTLLLTVALGLFWGYWAIWPLPAGKPVSSAGGFALFALLAALPLVPAYVLLGGLGMTTFRAPRWSLALIGLAHLGLFLTNVLPQKPLALFVLPPLLLVVWLALRRSRRMVRGPTIFESLAGRVRLWNAALLLVVPLTAMVSYGALLSLRIPIPTNIHGFLATSILGVLFFFGALAKFLRPAEGLQRAAEGA